MVETRSNKRKAKKDEVDDLRKKQEGLVASHIKELCSTESGIAFLVYLKDLSGYQRSSVTMDPNTGELRSEGTMYNEGRRSIYLAVRRLMPESALTKVEIKRSKK